MMTMSSKERVLKAVAHETTDRIPVDYSIRMDVSNKLIKYLGLENIEQLYQKLGIDIRKITIGEHHPRFDKAANGILKGQSENSGGKYIFHDDGTYENAWGIIQKPSSDGLYDEWIRGPFSNTMDLDSFNWPDMNVFDSVETIKKKVDNYQGKYALRGLLNYPFKLCWQMRGLENFLCDMLIEPEFAKEFLLKIASYETEKGIRMIRAGVDIVSLIGDIAMQDRLMVNVNAWREIDKPIFADMIAKFKKEKKDVLVFYHSDGNIEEVIPDLIEIGVDIINPVQPECMDVVKIKEKYGDKITLHGSISIQKTLPYGSVEDVRREVADRIELCGKDGGLILAPSNLIQNDTSFENILEIYKEVGSFVV
ncbi:MAG TPA: uroporphyrinogen decarboxylase family protein [Ruminiclostridium sp.]